MLLAWLAVTEIELAGVDLPEDAAPEETFYRIGDADADPVPTGTLWRVVDLVEA